MIKGDVVSLLILFYFIAGFIVGTIGIVWLSFLVFGVVFALIIKNTDFWRKKKNIDGK